MKNTPQTNNSLEYKELPFMSNLKSFSGKELISILQNLGFETIRIKGSHHFLKHVDGRKTIIPIHSNEDIGIGLFMKILRDINLTKEEFNQKIK